MDTMMIPCNVGEGLRPGEYYIVVPSLGGKSKALVGALDVQVQGRPRRDLVLPGMVRSVVRECADGVCVVEIPGEMISGSRSVTVRV
jgi:hypothetical protein